MAKNLKEGTRLKLDTPSLPWAQETLNLLLTIQSQPSLQPPSAPLSLFVVVTAVRRSCHLLQWEQVDNIGPGWACCHLPATFLLLLSLCHCCYSQVEVATCSSPFFGATSQPRPPPPQLLAAVFLCSGCCLPPEVAMVGACFAMNLCLCGFLLHHEVYMDDHLAKKTRKTPWMPPLFSFLPPKPQCMGGCVCVCLV